MLIEFHNSLKDKEKKKLMKQEVKTVGALVSERPVNKFHKKKTNQEVCEREASSKRKCKGESDMMLLFSFEIIVINDTSRQSECPRIKASLVIQPRVGVVSQESGSESSSYIGFHSKY